VVEIIFIQIEVSIVRVELLDLCGEFGEIVGRNDHRPTIDDGVDKIFFRLRELSHQLFAGAIKFCGGTVSFF
jgi:hypothetical protein